MSWQKEVQGLLLFLACCPSIATRLEAIAIRLEAIAIGLEAFPFGLEAIACCP